LVLVLLLWFAGGTFAAILAQSFESLLHATVVLCIALFTGVPALWHWKNSPIGLLQWDGETWTWAGDTLTGNLRVVIDLQLLVLIRVQTLEGSRQFLWLESRRPSLEWSALRRALVADTAPAEGSEQSISA
jgi:hypothetical protein